MDKRRIATSKTVFSPTAAISRKPRGLQKHNGRVKYTIGSYMFNVMISLGCQVKAFPSCLFPKSLNQQCLDSHYLRYFTQWQARRCQNWATKIHIESFLITRPLFNSKPSSRYSRIIIQNRYPRCAREALQQSSQLLPPKCFVFCWDFLATDCALDASPRMILCNLLKLYAIFIPELELKNQLINYLKS